MFRIIITYNIGGYTDPAFFFREVNERQKTALVPDRPDAYQFWNNGGGGGDKYELWFLTELTKVP